MLVNINFILSLISFLLLSNQILSYSIGDLVDYKEWSLYWNDEFNSNTLNLTSWNPLDKPPGEQELQYYNSQNCLIENGNLVFKVVQDQENNNFTSCVIISNLSFTYGRIESKIKLPIGQGFWPSFWMIPNKYSCDSYKEIDIMVNNGKNENENIIGSYISGSSCETNNSITNSTYSNLNEYHIYSLIWDYNNLVFMIDNIPYLIVNTTSQIELPNDLSFKIIMNMALGGDWSGEPNNSTIFQNNYAQVDYIRVYKRVGEVSKTPTNSPSITEDPKASSANIIFSFNIIYSCIISIIFVFII